MTQHFERIATTYIDAEREYAAELEAAGVEIRHVGPEFFGDVLDRWEQSWRQKAPVLVRLRQLAAAESGAAEAGR
jgi:hypothetical protein